MSALFPAFTHDNFWMCKLPCDDLKMHSFILCVSSFKSTTKLNMNNIEDTPVVYPFYNLNTYLVFIYLMQNLGAW